ncbi:MAG: tRNA uridine-5-carboxymethylaminomethyl(34) synthesis GTPase MnmE [Verrucomicrobia bacterium]|nr:tRNA uridine-5-carboxymethylaminomethyl(34) synthesis GTPase MnmE [Verrucomicrobiota bacterium]
MTFEDTIAAISTPIGEGALAVIRLSGPDALSVLTPIFISSSAPKKFVPRRVIFGRIHDVAGKVDEVLVTYFQAPNSYTGEDVVEISCHGGILVTRRVLDLLLLAGTRMANPGEFTQRAFLNGKIDLTQAEAVMDLIRAQTELALRAANEQLAGHLGNELTGIRELLLTTLAHVEAYIDFPDEQIDPDTGKKLLDRILALENRLDRLLATADQGRVLRHGLRTVIYGAPNVGKSSLLNLLLGYDRAIVSEVPGTTRDTIEEVINIRGIPVRLIDTAGARSSSDLLESEGIRRTLQQVKQADLVIQVVDGSKAPMDFEVFDNRNSVLLLNKCDLGIHPRWSQWNAVWFSCTEKTGLEDLNQAIWDRVMGEAVKLADVRVAINARHQACLQIAKELLVAGGRSLQEGKSPEFVSIELRGALDAVGEVIGKIDPEDLLGRIFSEFCIGK